MVKKTRERFILNEVKSLYDSFPQETILDNESPDFLIKMNGEILGIELVDYIRGQTKEGSINRHKEMIWQEIINSAHTTFEAKFNFPVVVYFQCYPHRCPLRTEINQLSECIIYLVESHIPSEYSKSVYIKKEEFDDAPLEKYLHSITILKAKKQGLWSCIGVGFIGVQVDELQNIISSKNEKVNEYLMKCDSVWLIIVADGKYISSNVDLPENILTHAYQSQFERVIFYDRIYRKVYSLLIYH